METYFQYALHFVLGMRSELLVATLQGFIIIQQNFVSFLVDKLHILQ